MFEYFKKRQDIPANAFVSVVSGTIVPLTTVNDPAFREMMMGDGVAIIPDTDDIVSPCEGKITMLYPTMHAFGIKNIDGVEVLVHIGIDTVSLKGKGFRKYINEGDIVKAGDKIIRIDSYEMKKKNIDLTTMVLFPKCEKELNIKREGSAKKGKTIIANY